jgi:hypothetical protein
MMYCLTEQEYQELKNNAPLLMDYEKRFNIITKKFFEDLKVVFDKHCITTLPPGMVKELHDVMSSAMRNLTPPSTDATRATSST